MSLIADGLLIATCLTAALYCFILSRRLKKLTSTEDGIGQQILQLNGALEETRTAVKDIRGTAKAASDRLSREVQNARRSAQELQRLTEAAQQILDTSRETTPAPAPKVYEPEPEVHTATDLSEVEIFDEDEEDPDIPGEDQLGFIPDQLDDAPPPVAATAAPEREDATEALADQEFRDADAVAGETGEADVAGDDQNLIRVERMAL